MNDVALSLPEALAHAVRAFGAGKYNEAEQICLRILAKRGDYFDAVHILAVTQSKLGRHDESLKTFERAAAMRPDSADLYCNLGITLREMKRYDDALASYQQAITIRPNYAEAYNNRGNVLMDLQRHEEAIESFQRALAVQPNYFDALDNQAMAFSALKRYDEALSNYDRLIAIDPQHVSTITKRATILKLQNKLDESLATYDRAIATSPDRAEFHNNRGNILLDLKRFDEALAAYDRALELSPRLTQAHNNRGKVLQHLKRVDEALRSYEQALAIDPNDIDGHFSRGNALSELGRFQDAIAEFDTLLALQPGHVNALNNRGYAQKSLGRFADALESYERSIVIQPDYAEGHWNESLIRLMLGDFVRGWPKYEWRWKNAALNLPQRNFPQPLWLGMQSLSGKTIMVHTEQGIGDIIQFSRYVPLLADRGARVVLALDPPLRTLMSSLRGVAQMFSAREPIPLHDVQCPLLSLPLAFGTQLATIPSMTGYLNAPAQSVALWRSRLGPRTRPRIGLAWSGSATHANDRNRSIHLRAMLPLLDAAATFYSLQKDPRPDDAALLKTRSDIIDFSEHFTDLSETAALITHLDLVISVDTSIVHLAGALGKPVWVFVPDVPDWRWMLDRDDSPWYPTARLFRQDAPRSWDRVVARIRAALDEVVAKG